MNDSRADSFLEIERLSVLMWGYVVPCIISLLVAAFYSIAGRIFTASAGYLGSYGDAASTVVFPFAVVVLVLAAMVGDGCCAFASLSLGSGRKESAHCSVGNSVMLRIVISLILTAIYFLFQEPTVTMSGG